MRRAFRAPQGPALTQAALAPADSGRGGFIGLRVSEVTPVADDAVAVSFDLSPEQERRFDFQAGQHLTLRLVTAGVELRRTYSICVPPGHGRLTIGVRKLPGGAFSTFVHDQLRVGDVLEVMEPAGHFTVALDPQARHNYVAVAAGSGVTPVISILETVLERERHSQATLLYGNRTVGSTMFLDQLADLKDRHPGRFQLVEFFSRERQQVEFLNGRLDQAKVAQAANALLDIERVDNWLICGPHPMLAGVRRALEQLGVPADRVRSELFFVEDAPPERTQAVQQALARPGEAMVTARLDGRETTFAMERSAAIVDGLLRTRGDAPFSCKGGVCATCRARLVEGEVAMDHTYALEPREREDGFILTCQAHPLSDRVVVDYDA
ncbi:MAG: 2Fe-2S iron-sulfur cluster binding domain-containing protein [Candidatus Dormibacteraeota bacterium]|nr:2Fe-2S iron-sulfur cluster binding domain-containing protein [Candidatus Dormibacteraeota bacterium]